MRKLKKKTSLVFDKEEEKITQLFTELGMPRNLSKTLMYISQVEECRSADVEKGADLRQPEVSIAIQELLKKGWITKRELKKKGKGRPVHIYKNSMQLTEIMNHFEEEKNEELNSVKKDLTELKTLISNI